MKKQHEIFFKHMLMAIEKIGAYLIGLDENSFKSDSKTVDAVIRQLEIIGEAAKNISANHVKDSPIPWTKITGLRNRLIHDYFGVDLDIVWQTAKNGTVPLKKYLITKV